MDTKREIEPLAAKEEGLPSQLSEAMGGAGFELPAPVTCSPGDPELGFSRASFAYAASTVRE